MKKILYMVIALGMLSTFAEARWLKLSYEQCNRYAGNGDPKGVVRVGANRGCFGYFKRAKKICRKVGGRLPSRRDFNRLASQCGFKFLKYGGDLSSKSHDCLVNKGFSVVAYWTRDRHPVLTESRMSADLLDVEYRRSLIYADRNELMCVK